MSQPHSLRSRKILSFCLLTISVAGLTSLTTYIGTPENVAIQALWVVGAAGLFTIGGQSLVDSVMRWRQGAPETPPKDTL